jgi:hypothetical protein
MPKEDRSDWVAVGADASAAYATVKIRPATSAYAFFQKDATEDVKADLRATTGKFNVADFSRGVKDRWTNLDSERRAHYEDLARDDQARYARESHAADIAALERRERLRQEREQTVMLDNVEAATGKRSTRRQLAKQERKKERKEKKMQKRAEKRKVNDDDDDFEEEEEESSDSYEEESDEESSDADSDDSDRPRKKKKAPPPKRQPTEKQLEFRQKKQEEKLERETIIAERQEDLRKDKADQAKRRLEFLLKQSNIFSHFGQVKQDQAKYGMKVMDRKTNDGSAPSRRDTVEDETEDLDEADTHQATFLTSQPTTLAFGQMRQYQLEGLNWMIRLQENGLNGILADEVGHQPVVTV